MQFQEIGKFELDEQHARNWGVKGLILLLVSFPLFLFLPVLFEEKVTWSFNWILIPVNLLMTGGLLLLHELIHGLTIWIFGGKPHYSYGVKEGIPYLATTTDKLLALPKYMLVALAPIIIITFLGVVAIGYYPQANLWLAFPLALHTSGAVGDLAMGRILLKYPVSSFIQDDMTGFTVFKVSEFT